MVDRGKISERVVVSHRLLPGHWPNPLSLAIHRTISLTSHLDPVKGGRSLAPNNRADTNAATVPETGFFMLQFCSDALRFQACRSKASVTTRYRPP